MIPQTFSWISVKDRMPKDGSPVLVWYDRKDGNEGILFWNADSVEKMQADFERLGFSHWMDVQPPEL